ncbi:chromosomal replication initiator protein DnaA, partial [Candidatus Parcubacteria bacterium]|nr:chromosomal replication initiator protein DnaA [Candidatus Parcubacteria bacterium]
MNTHELWQATLGELELKLSKAHFTTWFRSTFIIDFQGNEVTVGVPNTFTKAWLEKKYHKDILLALQNITEQPLRSLVYKVETRATEPKAVIFDEQKQQTTEDEPQFDTRIDTPSNLGFTSSEQEPCNSPFTLNKNYTFDTFVVGKQNELAYAAAQAVASHPGGTYNPVFVYGDVGLGKTHLLQAIGHEMKRKNPNAKILYASCEHFTNEFIQSVRSGHAKEFKDRYRNVDLLLIDDIQFITGKEGTQEEFFHTFNTLHQSNKQIVISSDRAPKAIASLEKRLLSRLEWGMLVDIGAPDLETRIAILQIKCQKRGVELSRDILHHIAANIASNVRELEGALNKIVAYHQFKNIDATLETVIPIIDGFDLNTIKKTVSPKHIIQTVAEYFDIEIRYLARLNDLLRIGISNIDSS